MRNAVLLLLVESKPSNSTAPLAALSRDQIETYQQHILARSSAESARLLAPLFATLTLSQHAKMESCASDQSETLTLKLCLMSNQLIEYQFGLCEAESTRAPYFIDVERGKMGFRLGQAQSLKQDIFRAIGVKSGMRPRVLDCTAGLGRDALLLSAIKCEVTAIERHPLLFLALDDALRRCRAQQPSRLVDACQALQLHHGDAQDWLRNSNNNSYDVIYLDPMFPSRVKSAKVKREAQILQHYCHDAQQDDCDRLLEIALDKKFKRVCVKRALHSPYLNDIKPDQQYKGKSTRFDVYFSL